MSIITNKDRRSGDVVLVRSREKQIKPKFPPFKLQGNRRLTIAPVKIITEQNFILDIFKSIHNSLYPSNEQLWDSRLNKWPATYAGEKTRLDRWGGHSVDIVSTCPDCVDL